MKNEKVFRDFLKVIDECGLHSGEEYTTFMSVIHEHCIEKGIYDLETIKKTWFTFKNSLEDLVRNLHVREKELKG